MLTNHCRHVTWEIDNRRETSRVTEQLAHTYAVPGRVLRVVAVEAVRGGRDPEAFFSTGTTATASQIIAWYAMRWSIEVTNRDTQQHLGVEDPQGCTRQSVERTAPVAMPLDTLIVLWFAREGHRHRRPLSCPWDTSKTLPSFADMLRTLRQLSLKQHIVTWALRRPRSAKSSTTPRQHGGIETLNLQKSRLRWNTSLLT